MTDAVMEQEQEQGQEQGETPVPEAVDIESLNPVVLPSKITLLDPDEIVVDEQNNVRRFTPNAARIEELAKDIMQRGQLAPVLVRKIQGKMVLVDGFNRTKAIQLINAGHPKDVEPLKVAAVVVDVSDVEAFVTGASANIKRVDMTPIDHAKVIGVLTSKYGMQQKDVAKVLGRSPSWVSEHAKIGEMRPKIQRLIHDGKVPYTTARMLIGASEEDQDKMVDEVLAATQVGKGGKGENIREKVRAKKRAQKQAKGEDVKVPLTLKEVRGVFEAVAGVGKAAKEEGYEYPYSEEAQAVGGLLVKLLDGKISEKVFVKRLEDML